MFVDFLGQSIYDLSAILNSERMVPTDPIACVSFWYYFKSESAKLTVSISKGIEGTHSQQQGLDDYDIFRLYAEKNNGWKNAKV